MSYNVENHKRGLSRTLMTGLLFAGMTISGAAFAGGGFGDAPTPNTNVPKTQQTYFNAKAQESWDLAKDFQAQSGAIQSIQDTRSIQGKILDRKLQNLNSQYMPRQAPGGTGGAAPVGAQSADSDGFPAPLNAVDRADTYADASTITVWLTSLSNEQGDKERSVCFVKPTGAAINNIAEDNRECVLMRNDGSFNYTSMGMPYIGEVDPAAADHAPVAAMTWVEKRTGTVKFKHENFTAPTRLQQRASALYKARSMRLQNAGRVNVANGLNVGGNTMADKYRAMQKKKQAVSQKNAGGASASNVAFNNCMDGIGLLESKENRAATCRARVSGPQS